MLLDFKATGLPSEGAYAIVERAFLYAASSLKPMRAEMFAKASPAVHVQMQRRHERLEEKKKNGMSEEKYLARKKKIERARRMLLEAVHDQVRAKVNERFMDKAVGAARALMVSTAPSPDLMAAAILSFTARSPVDCERLRDAFNDNVYKVVARMRHNEVYPTEVEENLRESSDDVKRVSMACLIARRTAVLEEVERCVKRGKPFRVSVDPAGENAFFNSAKLVWGVDGKMDERLVEVFNRVNGYSPSTRRFEVGSKGELQMVDDPFLAQSPGRKEPGGKRLKTNLGGKVFNN